MIAKIAIPTNKKGNTTCPIPVRKTSIAKTTSINRNANIIILPHFYYTTLLITMVAEIGVEPINNIIGF